TVQSPDQTPYADLYGRTKNNLAEDSADKAELLPKPQGLYAKKTQKADPVPHLTLAPPLAERSPTNQRKTIILSSSLLTNEFSGFWDPSPLRLPSFPPQPAAPPCPPTLAWGIHITTTSSSSTKRRAASPKPSSPPPAIISATSSFPAAIDEDNLYKAHKVSSQNTYTPISLVHLFSFAFLAIVLVVQFFFADTPSIHSRTVKRYSPTSFSPPAHIVEGGTCESPPPFPTEHPISRPHTMALAAEAKRIAADFEISDTDLNKINLEFVQQMKEGLAKNATNMSQIPTFVTAVPNGTEKGLYLAVDLGGTNFRVCSINLHGDTTFDIVQSKVAIPKELMVAKTAKELFSFLAKQIELFLREHHEDHFNAHIRRRQTISTPEGFRDEHIFRLGFTFSFPVHQIGINRGTLMRWTKGFDIADAVGQDVCKLLQDEIDILKLPVRVAALVNDTVGTLMARSYTSPGKTSTLLGAIFGTGTNGAYVERLDKITKPMDGEFDNSTGDMVVNTEWGSFDNSMKVLPSTIYDQILDQESVNPGIQMFEKRVSGMFLGEILRIVLVQTLKTPAVSLFSGLEIASTAPLHATGGVDSSILSEAEADSSADLSKLREYMKISLGVSAATVEDALAVKEIAHAIAIRAARLSGIAIGAIILETGRLNPDVKSLNLAEAASATVSKLANTAGLAVNEDEIVDVGVDGSLVEFYPKFEEYMREALRTLDGIGAAGERRIRIGIAKDGSGVGAALIALVAAKMEKPLDYLTPLKGKLDEIKAGIS
ncbi:Glucokinase, partial [Lachnellula willkommii]